MPKTAVLQTSFAAGELAPEIALRRDTKQYQDGAKSLLNSRLLATGGARRRPGSWRCIAAQSNPRLVSFVVSSTVKYVLSFSAGRMDAYLVDVSTGDLTASGSLTGCPWTGTEYKTMDYAASGNTIIVTHPSFLKVITRTGLSSWTIGDFPFSSSSSNRIRQPHYKIAPRALTLRPSALQGAITLTASASYFTASYVGKHLRILDREVLITGYTSGTQVSATVLERLRPTQTLTVADATDFAVDDVVEGTTSGAKGQVVSKGDTISTVTGAVAVGAGSGFADGDTVRVIGGVGTPAELTITTDGSGHVSSLAVSKAGSYYIAPTNPVGFTVLTGGGTGLTANLTLNATTSTMTVVITDRLTKFQAEDINGPNAKTTASAATDASPAAVKDWTEPLYSDVAGYPNCVEIHRSRILFGGSAGARSAIAGSSVSDVYDFDIGTGSDGDGFLETIGDSGAVQVVQMHSAEQLIALTDMGPYYVPESTTNPFRPTSLAFNHFGGEWECSDVRTQDFDGGVVFVSGSIIVKCMQTGNITQMWDAVEKSFLCPHVIKNPVDAAVTANFAGGPERYCCLINSDGTAAVMQLIDTEQVRNFVPWETTGEFVSACGVLEFLYAAVKRTIDGVDVYWIERFDDDLTIDGATQFADKAAMDAGYAAIYGAEEVHVVADGPAYLGVYPPDYVDLPAGPYNVGFYYDRVITTLPPNIEGQNGSRYGEQMRIMGAEIGVVESARFETNGTALAAYMASEDPSADPPLRTGPRRFEFFGWDVEPAITITQPDPMPLTVLGIKTKVAY